MLVLLHIEGVVVVPAENDSVHESLETVVISALVGASTHCRVTIRQELVVVWFESLPSFLCRSLQHDNHEGTHEESCICLLGVVQARIVINLIVLVLSIVH